MAGSILGNRVARTEDPELLTAGGTYVYDVDLPGVTHAVFVRSPFAHALVGDIDIAEAEAAPGVVAVHTGRTIGLDPGHGFVKVDDAFARHPIAVDRVRFVGEAVAVVVAETLAEAQDAAELVFVDYEPLPVLVDPEAALDAEVSLFDGKPDNLAITATDPATDVLAEADVVVRGRYLNQRLAAAPIEPNSAAAAVGDDGRVTVWAATQMPHLLQRQLAGATG
ncbi:MAG: molybdopterin cofactor-binding domain-containing protein, partial [Actinomycetota bacterium]